jgi:hypothetical protein
VNFTSRESHGPTQLVTPRRNAESFDNSEVGVLSKAPRTLLLPAGAKYMLLPTITLLMSVELKFVVQAKISWKSEREDVVVG